MNATINARETAAIQGVVKRARFRIRVQGAMEGATTAIILAAVLALVAIFAMRIDLVSTTTGLVMLCFANPIVIAGALIGAFRRIDDEAVARRIDRASNLSDRLSTAIAFQRMLALSPDGTSPNGTMPASAASEDAETHDLMVAAIRDGVKAAPRANVKAATPFTLPKDLKAALGFVVVSALAAGLAVPQVDHLPQIYGAEPNQGPPGTEVILRGTNLLAGVTTPVALGQAKNVVGAPNDTMSIAPPAPANGETSVYLGPTGKGRPIEVMDWTKDTIKVRIPKDAPFGDTELTVYLGTHVLGPVPFTVLDPSNPENFRPEAVILDADERAYVDSILAQLKELNKREKLDDLDKFIAKIEQLLKDVEQGKISKEQLLSELAKAEEMLNSGKDPDQAEIAKKMGEMGKELKKSEVTKELGQALEKNDLDKAKQELEELARKLEKSGMEKKLAELEKQLQDPKLTEQQKKDIQKKIDELKKEMNKDLEELKKQLEDKDGKLSEQEKKDLQKKIDELKNEKPLTDKQKEELQKQLENVSKQMQKQDDKQKQQDAQQQQKLQDEIKRLQKQKDEAKNEQERLNAERQLQKKKDELQKLEKKDQDKEKSAQREAIKRLQRDMEKAAEQLQKKDPNESQQDQEQREREASRKIKDAARETGKVDQEQRKQQAQKKMASQMEELREAMRRAKQKGNKGPNDPFGKNAKNDDFGKRSKGQKGNGQAWKPGGNQPGGQGQNQPGGKGQQPGGKEWGVGHDENLTGDSTDKSGKTKEEDLAGVHGKNGSSKRETILAAAQKGFASTSYKKVYQDYEKIVEEVMRTEKMPSSYKYYVKRYFAKIHPSGTPDSVAAPQTPETLPAPAPKKN